MTTTTIRSLLSYLECSACGAVHDAHRQQNLPTVCARPLLARYALADLDGPRWRAALRERPWSLWRYAELLPVANLDDRVSLGEVVTPLLDLPRTAARLGLTHLRAKDEGLLPMGSSKTRGAAVGISRAREVGVTHVALPTAGAGGAWAACAARSGLRATVVMPEDAPTINVREAVVSGSSVYLVRGLISDAGALVARYIERAGEASGAAPFDAAMLRETKGRAVSVSDDEIARAVYQTAQDDGLFLSSEGAAPSVGPAPAPPDACDSRVRGEGSRGCSTLRL